MGIGGHISTDINPGLQMNSESEPNPATSREGASPLPGRKDVLKLGAAVGLAALGASCGPIRTLRNTLRRMSGSFDVILWRGTIVDGRGGPGFEADIGIHGDEITAIGNLSDARAANNFDCTGYHVFPGFVDLHSHSDYVLFEDRRAFSKIFQGVTTEIVGQDGRSPGPFTPALAKSMHAYLKKQYSVPYIRDVSDYYDALEELRPALNVKTMIGAGILRQGQAGYNRRKLDREEIKNIRKLIESGLSDGACGISSGLEYLPNAHSDAPELIEMCKGSPVYSTHMRNEDDRVIEALLEAIRIARDANVPLNISHFKLQGKRNWNQIHTAFQVIQEARKEGLRVTMDRYPYLAYHTSLNSLFPIWAQRKGIRPSLKNGDQAARLRRDLESKVQGIGGYDRIHLGVVYSRKYEDYSGKSIAELSRIKGKQPFDLMLDIAGSGSASTVVFAMSPENLRRIYSDPFVAVASDGSALPPGMSGRPHPRNYGTFTHFLEMIRKEKFLSLEEAVRKCTALPASIAGLADSGQIQEGYKADIAIFDLSRLRSYASYENPVRISAGVEALLVNGEFVIRNTLFTGVYPGRPLREVVS